MTKSSERRATGAELYTGLSIFIERVMLGRTGELPKVVLPVSGPLAYSAFLSGVPEMPDAGLPSAAYTVIEVARMVVAEGKAANVIFTGESRGLGFRLQSELPLKLAGLLDQLGVAVETYVRTEGSGGTLPLLAGGVGVGTSASVAA